MSSPNGNGHHDSSDSKHSGAANDHHDTVSSSQHSSAIHHDTTSHHDAIEHHTTTNQQRRYTNGLPPAGDPFAVSSIYYGPDGPGARREPKNRTQSQIIPSGSHPMALDVPAQPRRGSVDEQGERVFQINDVEAMYHRLLHQEDTDGNGQITVEDMGPKTIQIGTFASRGLKSTDLRGTYMLANLLQELTLAREAGRGDTNVIIQEARIAENPVDRLSRFIRDAFWKNLTRRIDGGNVLEVASDPKDWTANPRPRIYVPHGAPEQYAYYQAIAEKQRQEQESNGGSAEHHKILDVQWLAKDVTPEYIRDLNNAPGLLAVGMDEVTDKHGHKTLQGKPFIVPGGRFNEFYGWDSYMGSLGLIIHKRVDICKSMVENFTFCIQHYGKILNANRSYYLGRSQPPFLTDMVLRVWDQIPHDEAGLEFIRKGTLAAIKEYFNVWMSEPRLDPVTGLSRYRPVGVGVPPETESTHFLHVLEPYAQKHGLEYQEFVKRYNSRDILEPELDEYFLHDRAVRESGHDTSYRLEGVAANLATIDLNSCLFKIESDIARIIRFVFDDKLPVPPEFQTKDQFPGHVETSAAWERRWKKRRVAMDKYMWDEERGMYLDYDTVKKQRTTYESATTFWAMWSGVATPRQAAHMVIKALPKFEMHGGLVSGTKESRGAVGLHRPNRQWDYPFAWAPHQILAWNGMQRYGYIEEAQRLAYRWCHMVTNAFISFNGIVVEKYDLTRTFDPQRVEAEYGNQGADFKGVPKEGFGWVNASYIVGIDLLTTHQKKVLGTNISWEEFSKTVDSEIYSEEAVAAGSGFPEQVAAERGIPQNYIGPYGTGSGHVGHARGHDGSNGHH